MNVHALPKSLSGSDGRKLMQRFAVTLPAPGVLRAQGHTHCQGVSVPFAVKSSTKGADWSGALARFNSGAHPAGALDQLNVYNKAEAAVNISMVATESVPVASAVEGSVAGSQLTLPGPALMPVGSGGTADSVSFLVLDNLVSEGASGEMESLDEDYLKDFGDDHNYTDEPSGPNSAPEAVGGTKRPREAVHTIAGQDGKRARGASLPDTRYTQGVDV